jgi:predicted metal-dependent peptidase
MDPVARAMLKARATLLMDQPFFGQIIMHLEVEDASSWCETAATDGRKFYYNREFIKTLKPPQLLFLHAHEVLHVVYEHMFRRGDRDKALYNMSADYLVNYVLTQANIGDMPLGGLIDRHITDDLSTEEIYALLEKRAVKIQQTLDVHLDIKGSKNGPQQAESGQSSSSGPPQQLSAEEIADIRETMRSVVMQAAQNSPAGKLPAGIKRMINQLLTPKINWRRALTTILRSTIKYDYTYMRPSRRSYQSGILLPGQDVLDKLDVVVFIDGSGSTTREMVTDFLSECQGISRTFRDFKMLIGTFDTSVYNVRTFSPHNGEIAKYELIGGGGTIPSCCWDYMRQNQIRPMLLLIFTDGQVDGDWGAQGYAETIFVIHSAPHIKAPYGRTIHYEP